MDLGLASGTIAMEHMADPLRYRDPQLVVQGIERHLLTQSPVVGARTLHHHHTEIDTITRPIGMIGELHHLADPTLARRHHPEGSLHEQGGAPDGIRQTGH